MALSKNPLLHSGHLKGFLPQCVCRCRVSVELLPKFMPHTPHECTPGARGCQRLWAKCCAHGSTAPPCYRRPADSVCSKASWWWCPSGAPTLVEAQCALAERAGSASVAVEPGGVGSGGSRRGRATGALFGAGRGGCCGESSGRIRCRYRASGQRGCVGACAARQLRHSARRSPGSRSRGRCCGSARATAAPNCSGSSCHTHCTRKACLQPLLMQQTW